MQQVQICPYTSFEGWYNAASLTPELPISALKSELVYWDFSNMEYIPTLCQHNGNSIVIFTLIMGFSMCTGANLLEFVQSVTGKNWFIPLGLSPLKCAERKIDASSPFKPLRWWANIPSKPFKRTRPSSPSAKKANNLSCCSLFSSSFFLCCFPFSLIHFQYIRDENT